MEDKLKRKRKKKRTAQQAEAGNAAEVEEELKDACE